MASFFSSLVYSNTIPWSQVDLGVYPRSRTLTSVVRGAAANPWRYHQHCLATLLESFLRHLNVLLVGLRHRNDVSSFTFSFMMVVYVPRSSSVPLSHLSHRGGVSFGFRPRREGASQPYWTLSGHLVLGVCQRLVLRDLLLTVPRCCSCQP